MIEDGEGRAISIGGNERVRMQFSSETMVWDVAALQGWRIHLMQSGVLGMAKLYIGCVLGI